jgi:hypothetical protein
VKTSDKGEFAIKSDGKVFARSIIRLENFQSNYETFEILPFNNVIQVSGYGNPNAVLQSNGKVLLWHSDILPEELNISNISQISFDALNPLLLNENGTVFIMDKGFSFNRNIREVPKLHNIIQILAMNSISLALDSTGNLYHIRIDEDLNTLSSELISGNISQIIGSDIFSMYLLGYDDKVYRYTFNRIGNKMNIKEIPELSNII